MGNELMPRPSSSIAQGELISARPSKRVMRALAEVEGMTLVRRASVRSEGLVARDKLREIDFLTWEAMSGHAMLVGWANHLAGEDPILADELRFFKDTSRLAKGEIIADSIDQMRRL